MPLWRAGEVVPAGTYVRVDDRSYRAVILDLGGRCQQRLMGMWQCIVHPPAHAGIMHSASRLLTERTEQEMRRHGRFMGDAERLYPLSTRQVRCGRGHVLRGVHIKSRRMDKRHRDYLMRHVCAASVVKEAPDGSSSSDTLPDTRTAISLYHTCASCHECFSCLAISNTCCAFHAQLLSPDTLSLLFSPG